MNLLRKTVATLYCPHCGIEILESEPKFCPNCGKQILTQVQTKEERITVTEWKPALKYPSHQRRPNSSYRSYSAAWYLLPILFGFIGGILAYLGVRDEDEGAARLLLGIGLVFTVVWIWLAFLLLG